MIEPSGRRWSKPYWAIPTPNQIVGAGLNPTGPGTANTADLIRSPLAGGRYLGHHGK